MSENEILYLQKKLEENILALAAKNKEIKRLKEEIEKSKNLRDVSKLEEENRNLKSLNERDQKEINQLLETIKKIGIITEIAHNIFDSKIQFDENLVISWLNYRDFNTELLFVLILLFLFSLELIFSLFSLIFCL